MVNRYVIGTKTVLRGFDSASESHQSPVPSFRRKPESRGEGWHQPRPNTSNDQVSFSYLGVPAPAGMDDWYESMSRTPIRDAPTRLSSAPLNPSIPRSRHSGLSTRHSREGGNPEGKGGTNHTQTLPTTGARFHTLVCRHQPAWTIGTKMMLRSFDSASESHQSPVSSFVRKHVPDSDPGFAPQSTSMPALPGRNVPNCRPMIDGGTRKCSAVEDFARRGACPPLGSEWGVAESTVPTRHTKSQLRVFTPSCAGPSRDERSLMKACPGLRSGIDRSGSLSFAIRGIPSPIRTPVRHSGEGRNPEGVGRGKATRRWKKPTCHLLSGLRKALAILAIDAVWALRLRQLTELARPYTKTTQRPGQT